MRFERRMLVVAITAIALAPAAAEAHPSATAATAPGPLDALFVNLLRPHSAPVTGGPDKLGVFSAPFVEPTADGKTTSAKCVTRPGDGLKVCKPAGATVNVLPNGKILFWDALEGTENVKFSIVSEFGKVATNDSARLLTLGATPSFATPAPFDGGANPKGTAGQPLLPGLSTTEKYNDGALFGSHETFLADGKLLVQGGTDYALDPGVDSLPYGASELEGLKSTRIYDPKTNAFTQTGDTHAPRWYPTLVETGDGSVLDFSGVEKLLKPVYPTHPLDSGRNVTSVERYNVATGKWTDQGASAHRSLPLYPRLHLLPDGHVYYNAAGQDFNPFGQAYDEAGWMEAASFDPATKTWSNLGIPNVLSTAPGFRGSTFSTMLPLKPGADGNYTKASFLTAGGVLLPSPGSYFAVADSNIATVDTAGGKDKLKTHTTAPLHQPRWFGSGTLLPTGEVLATSGADKDEVLLPGTEAPDQQAELFNPDSETWQPVATAHNPRTYHNTAVVLPSGKVLVGGHATISTLYLNNTTLPGLAPHDGRDPSFEFYSPPYLFRGPRPVIRSAPSKIPFTNTFAVKLRRGSGVVKSVVLVRNAAITHLVDGEQRNVELRVISRKGNTLTVAAPPNGNVAPPGPYMLFVNRATAKGPVPSRAKMVLVG